MLAVGGERGRTDRSGNGDAVHGGDAAKDWVGWWGGGRSPDGVDHLAGTPASAAVTATLLYRLVSYWLAIPAGGVAYLLFRRRYG
jgi:hypothetical protein